MIRGATINVAVNPLAAKQLLPEETFAPGHLELRNGLRTDGGFYRARPGYNTRWDLSLEQPITLLIPKPRTENDIGFAVTEHGQIHELHADFTSSLMTGPTLNGVFRPTWCEFDNLPIVCDGQAPVQIDPAGTTTALLSGSPPAAKYCAVMADRVILSGYDDTGFQWSDPGSAISWPPGNVSSVTGHGERIRYMQAKDTDLYFFKDASLEIWSHIGGIEVFGRRGIITFANKTMTKRPLASFSVVQAGSPPLFYWWADGDFWRLNGFTPERISAAYKRELNTLRTTHDAYGFDCQLEHVIRWFFPTEARCFTYDYVNNVFTEDNCWTYGAWSRLPIYAYMEVDGRAYVGDYNATGRISEWADTYHTDNGSPVRIQRTFTMPLSKDGHRAELARLRLRVKRGEGMDGMSHDLLVRWKFDESPWSPYASVDLGTAGDHDPYVDVLNVAGGKVLGKGRDVTIDIVQSSAIPHLLTHANLTIQPMGS